MISPQRLATLGFAGLLTLVSLGLPRATQAQYFGSGALTTSDPTYHPTLASSSGTGVQYYDVYQFTISVSGTFTFEVASLNTSPTGTPSNALDTLFTVYADPFNPVSPGGGLVANDTFSSTLTVLPGPFAGGGYTTASTGDAGMQPGSRVTFDFDITTDGTTFFLVISSFRNTAYVPPVGTSFAQPTGSYVFGISGPGTITVPEPTTTTLLIAAGGMGLVALRRRKSA